MIKNDHNLLNGFYRQQRGLVRLLVFAAIAAVLLAAIAPTIEVRTHLKPVLASDSDSGGGDPGSSGGNDPGNSGGSAPGNPGGDTGATGGDNSNPPSSAPMIRSWTLEQFVRNVTRGENFTRSTNAAAGDTLQFRFVASASGNAPITGITLRLNPPSQLQFVPGTAFIESSRGRVNVDHLLPVITGGALQPGETQALELNAVMQANGLAVITISAAMEAPGMSARADTTSVAVIASASPPPPAGTASLRVTAQVRNISRAEGTLRSRTGASPGESVIFSLQIDSVGTAIVRNVLARDQLPQGFTFEAGSTRIDSTPAPGDPASGFLGLGNLQPGQTKTVQFTARPIVGFFAAGSTTAATNTGIAQADNAPSAQGTAIVDVTVAPNQAATRNLEISELVRNVTRGEATFSRSTTASPGDTVQFQITACSTGNAPVTGIIFRDIFPSSQLSFIPGTATIEGPLGSTNVDPLLPVITNGSLQSAETQILRFNAAVQPASVFATGTTTVINTATIEGNNVPQRSDSVSVSVVVGAPALSISKLGRNITRGETALQRTVNAAPGEDVLWSIRVDSTGSAAARNVIVRDSLPWQDSYRTGSSRLEGNAVADGIANGGINIGDVTPGQSRIITFQTTVGGSNLFIPGTNTLTNFAFARADGLPNERQDNAQLAVAVPTSTPPPPTGQPSLSLTKLTRNVSRGEVGLVRVANASPLEIVEFSLRVNSTGTAPSQNVSIQDFLPGGLTLISGSVRLDGTVQPDAIAAGISLGTMPTGTNRTLTFQANVRDASFFASGVTTLTNFAIVQAGSASSQSDAAQVLITVNPTPAPSPNLSLFKTARNVTRGEVSFVKSTGADPGQELEFSIRVDSTGTTPAQNITVSDFLDRMTYIAGTTRLDAATTTDGVTSGGLAIGQITNGTSRTVTFRAQVRDASQFAAGTSVLTNTATASATNVPIRQDTATIIVAVGAVPPGGTPNLNIFKQIRNATRGESFAKSTSADPGQELEFSVRIDSNGTAPAQNVRVTDALPGRLVYLGGTTRIDGSGANDGITSGGLTLGTIPTSTARTITYRVRVADRSQFSVGQTALNNFATASADNTFSRQDTSSVLITISSGSFGNPVISLTKRMANGTRPNGSDFFDEGQPGDQLTYTFELRNTGTADLTNALIDDYLPSNTTFVSVSGNGFLSASNQVRWFMGTIPSGSVSTVSYTVQINSGLTDGIFITNRAQARADNASQADSNEVTTVIRETATTTNLQKTVDRPQARRGEALTYTINYVNSNSVDVRSLVFTDVLPPWVSLLSATPQPTNISGQQLEWRMASVAPGGNINLIVRTRISQNAPNGMTLTNVATLTSVNPHPHTAQAQASTTILPEEEIVARTTLPPTGANTVVSAVALSFLASIVATVLLYRRFVLAMI